MFHKACSLLTLPPSLKLCSLFADTYGIVEPPFNRAGLKSDINRFITRLMRVRQLRNVLPKKIGLSDEASLVFCAADGDGVQAD